MRFEGEEYRFGFNGMELDNEVYGNGNAYDFGARIYDSRLGRWMSLDPLASKYPDLSPYCFAGNTPIQAKDPDGKDIVLVNYDKWTQQQRDGWETLLKTESGKKLIEEMQKSTTHDIYIFQSNVQAKVLGPGATIDNPRPIEAGGLALANVGSRGDKWDNVIKADDGWFFDDFQVDEDYTLVSDARAKRGGSPGIINSNSLMVADDYEIENIDRTNSAVFIFPLTKSMDKYDLAETYYHEIYSHIYLPLLNGVKTTKEQHAKYGSEYMRTDIFNPTPDSPAEKINNELNVLEENDSQ